MKQVVNRMLRTGLNTQKQARALAPFRIKPRNMGLRPGLSFDSIEKLLEEGEGPLHR